MFGVEPELAGDTAESFKTGKIVTWPSGVDQPDDCRWAADAECGREELRAYPEVCGWDHHGNGGGDKGGDAGDCGDGKAGSGAERGGDDGGVAVSCGSCRRIRKAVAIVSGGNVDPRMLAESADGDGLKFVYPI